MAAGPTPAPTEPVLSTAQQHAQMIVSETLSLTFRFIIACICLSRLFHYHKARVLRWGDVKTVFHTLMFSTIFFAVPYFVFCDVHYDIFQCWASPDEDGRRLFFTSWVLYAWYRIGICLQLMCLSITVVTWSDFLQYGRYISDLFLVPRRSKPFRLRVGLLAVNVVCLILSLVLSAIIMSSPDDATDDSTTQSGLLTFVDWMALAVVELVVVLCLMQYGCRLLSRLRATVVFDDKHRSGMLLRLNVVLAIMTACLLIEVAARIINTMPLYVPNWDHRSHPSIFLAFQRFPIVWQLAVYILPYDVVSFCLLYLMRTPPKPRNPRIAAGPGSSGFRAHASYENSLESSSVASATLSQHFLGSELGHSLPTVWDTDSDAGDPSFSFEESPIFEGEEEEEEGGEDYDGGFSMMGDDGRGQRGGGRARRPRPGGRTGLDAEGPLLEHDFLGPYAYVGIRGGEEGQVGEEDRAEPGSGGAKEREPGSTQPNPPLHSQLLYPGSLGGLGASEHLTEAEDQTLYDADRSPRDPTGGDDGLRPQQATMTKL